MKRGILASLLVVGATAALITAATTAIFTDQVISEGNTLTAGTLFLSVDGDCGPPDRTSGGGGDGGGTPCTTSTEELSIANLSPGDSESHQFTIVNEGSLPGALSVSAELDDGTCFDVDVTGPVLATLDANGEANDTTTATVEVSMPAEAGNECQAAEDDVIVTFDLEQLP